MSTIFLPTSFNISITFPAASFLRRLAAWVIDIILLFCYYFLLLRLYTALFGHGLYGETAEAFLILLIVVPLMAYHPMCEIFLKGQSIGKKIMQIRVINDSGGRPSFSQAMIRWLIRTSDVMVVVILLSAASSGRNPQAFLELGVAFLLFLTDIILVNATPRHQRLGDILAHTILIRTVQKAGMEETIFQHVKEDYTPQFPQVLQLSDRDINSVKGILDSAKKHHDYQLAERAADKIKAHLHIENSMSPYDFLEILLKDYNYLTTH